MNELNAALKIVLANTYVMYFKAHSYHWNIEGMFFSMFHSFFGDLYDEVYSSIDQTAEHIRANMEYAPFSLNDVLSASTISEDTTRTLNAKTMIYNLLQANDEIIRSWNSAMKLAELENKQGLINYIAERLDIHEKHGWMLRSYMK